MRTWLQALVEQVLRAVASLQETPEGRAPAIIPPMPTHQAFTVTERKQLLQTFFALLWQRNEWNYEQCRLQERDPLEGKARLANYWKQYQAMSSQINQLENQYRAGVPIIPLSRCPYCQAINYHSFDGYDLDGLWWRSIISFLDIGPRESAVRPREQHRLCPHFWMLSGALTPGESFTVAPIMVHPGPDVPFVVTSLFQQSSMRVVISSLKVGVHTAYPIVYYSETKPVALEYPVAEWSNNDAVWVQENGRIQQGVNAYYYMPLPSYRLWDEDFELAPWIKGGQVYWIAPGDESLTLQQKTEECPYLNLPGRRKRLYISDGKCWGEDES